VTFRALCADVLWLNSEEMVAHSEKGSSSITPVMSGLRQLAVSRPIYALRCSLAGSGCIVGHSDEGLRAGCGRQPPYESPVTRPKAKNH
jgi:hypothetical protein